MDIAIVGASGSCGRQLAIQLLDRSVLGPDARLQLVGRRGGASEHTLIGLRTDLRDAFTDDAPWLEVVLDAESIAADIVVMLAGATVSRDPGASTDRAALVAENQAVFDTYATALARRPGRPPLVVVQSNPVEDGVDAFARAMGRHRVLGAGAWSDTLRFRREIADGLGLRRPDVRGTVLGQHGDHMVPLWSSVRAIGRSDDEVDSWVAAQREGRSLADLPDEIQTAKLAMLARVRAGQVQEAHDEINLLPADLRAAIKPFFVHFTAGHTTEVVTAHAVADLLMMVTQGHEAVVPAQIVLEGELDGLHGVGAVPVVAGPTGWTTTVDIPLASDERAALERAVAAGAVESTAS